MANQVSRYQPLSSALTLRDAIDRLFEDSFVWPRWGYSPDTVSGLLGTMPLDMYETADDVVVTVAMPGVKSENLNIQFNDGRLIIDANVPPTKLENVTWHYREIASGQIHREIALPVLVNADKADATLQEGVLTLRVPKAEEVKPKRIQIKANK